MSIEFLWRWYIKWLLVNDTAKLFDKLYGLNWHRELHERWLGSLQCLANERLLEVGCGTGSLSLSAARKQLLVTATDRSKKMIEAARANLGAHNGVTLKQADVHALPFENQRFSCVIAASLINIVDEPKQALLEMTRVLRSGGKLSFLVPNERMNKRNVLRFIETNRLTGFSAQALRSWRAFAPKLDRKRCLDLAHSIELQDVSIDERLDSMVYVVTGVKA